MRDNASGIIFFMEKNRTDHLKALDGARGVAALLIVFYHIGGVVGGGEWFSGAFLAVDFFFLLSGFVVARSYEQRLRQGSMSLRSFIWTRIIRLYPLYIAASMVGFAYFCIKLSMKMPDAPTVRQLIDEITYSLALIPHPAAVPWGFTEFPFAPTAWSLSFEFWFGILYALLLPRLSTRALTMVAIAGLCVLIKEAYSHGSLDMGFNRATALGGAARFWFSFTLGVIMNRMNYRIRPMSSRALWIGLPVFSFAILPHNSVTAGFFWIIVVFPLALGAGASIKSRGRVELALDHLGRLSYAIYIFHGSMILFAGAFIKRLFAGPLDDHRGKMAVITVAATLAVSAIATYLYDEPLRRRLKRGLRRNSPLIQVNSALSTAHSATGLPTAPDRPAAPRRSRH
ncbi:hypothetical protein B0A89_05895 [Paracoccus contaminans]|uniref:Acyltransferase 3 domain-containing protein n=2 Tax=Paracoccus contaminans TaxID=1945662 RepID=A0A1W6CWJ0_9RHOB|nr:hypothetical protein B0A89_05895 [Paracoccus contaminans]